MVKTSAFTVPFYYRGRNRDHLTVRRLESVKGVDGLQPASEHLVILNDDGRACCDCAANTCYFVERDCVHIRVARVWLKNKRDFIFPDEVELPPVFTATEIKGKENVDEFLRVTREQEEAHDKRKEAKRD